MQIELLQKQLEAENTQANDEAVELIKMELSASAARVQQLEAILQDKVL